MKTNTFEAVSSAKQKSNAARLLTIAFSLTLLASCSPRLVGTWSITHFETTTPGQEGLSLNNIGTVQFKKNGTGEKNINFSALGASHIDQTSFKWTWHDAKYVTIESENSEFAKPWIIITNKKKFQKWSTTDGTNKVQVIELKK